MSIISMEEAQILILMLMRGENKPVSESLIEKWLDWCEESAVRMGIFQLVLDTQIKVKWIEDHQDWSFSLWEGSEDDDNE